jgi:structural maintenance of chromosome 1
MSPLSLAESCHFRPPLTSLARLLFSSPQRQASNLQASAEATDPGLQKLQQEVAARRKTVEKLTQRINAAADRVFADFSRRVGVASVREWEETRLAELEQQENKKAELETQVGAPRSPPAAILAVW